MKWVHFKFVNTNLFQFKSKKKKNWRFLWSFNVLPSALTMFSSLKRAVAHAMPKHWKQFILFNKYYWLLVVLEINNFNKLTYQTIISKLKRLNDFSRVVDTKHNADGKTNKMATLYCPQLKQEIDSCASTTQRLQLNTYNTHST